MTPAPSLPGYSLLPPVAADLAEMADLVRAAERHDRLPEVTTDERLAHDFATDLEDPARDALLAREATGRAAGLAWLSGNRGGTRKARAIIWLVVHPDARDGALGDVLLDWLERRSREALSDVDPALPRLIRSWSPADATWIVDLHLRHGFAVARHFFEMRRDLSTPLPEPRQPAGVGIVPWEASLSESIRDAHNEAFADHWGSEPLDATRWRVAVDDDPNFRGDLSRVAVEDGRVVGYALNEVFPDDWEVAGFSSGWVASVGVRGRHRGRGVATALIAATMRAFADAGLEYATLGVDAANPTGALGLYERLGFETFHRLVTLVKEL